MVGLMNFGPVTLQGSHVRLEPLSSEHLDGFCEFGLDPELWRLTTTRLRTREDMIDYVETALRSEQEGTARPFATISLESSQVIGMIVQDGRYRHSVYFSVIDLNGLRLCRTSKQYSLREP